MKRFGVILAFLGAAVAAFVLWFALARPVLVLPRLRLAPGFSLTGADGASVTSEAGRGKITLYTFAFTNCQAQCAKTYDTLQAIDAGLSQWPSVVPPFRIVTLSIDPANDTPQTLASFRLPFQPKVSDWTWVTGSPERMKEIIGGSFEVLYAPQPDGSLVFSPRYVLVDGEGIIRGDYDGTTTSPESILNYLSILYEEIANTTGPGRMAYEAAHFFACYPH